MEVVPPAWGPKLNPVEPDLVLLPNKLPVPPNEDGVWPADVVGVLPNGLGLVEGGGPAAVPNKLRCT